MCCWMNTADHRVFYAEAVAAKRATATEAKAENQQKRDPAQASSSSSPSYTGTVKKKNTTTCHTIVIINIRIMLLLQKKSVGQIPQAKEGKENNSDVGSFNVAVEDSTTQNEKAWGIRKKTYMNNRQTDTQTHRQTDTQTHRQTDTPTHTPSHGHGDVESSVTSILIVRLMFS